MKITKLISFLFLVSALFLPQVILAAAEEEAAPQVAAEEKTDEAGTGPEYVYAVIKPGERDAGSLAVGQKAQAHVDMFPDKTFEGTLETVSPEAAKIRFENPDRLPLPGAFANIQIQNASYLASLKAPEEKAEK